MTTLQGLTLLTFATICYSCAPHNPEVEISRKEQGIRDAFEEDFRRTLDPALGYPPKERMILAYKQIERMRAEMASRRSSGVENPKFIERGPGNFGGRTRSIMIDVRDPERKTVWAGSVAGGLWKTTDITAVNAGWAIVNDYMANMAIGCMAQDPNNPDVVYVGTGEGFNNVDAVRGLGIFKTEDGGETWNLLPTTDNVMFRYTRDILVHPVTGHVYAATRSDGVRRSENGGATWVKVLGTSLTASNDLMFDLAYSDGTLYGSNSTNIYTSETGNRGDWTAITSNSSGFPETLDRLEFSVCQANKNILFAVGALNGGASDIYRTDNGGQSWAAVESPTGGDFTSGQVWYDLEIAVDPFNCNHVIVGGVSIYRTLTGGTFWENFTGSMHVDQHKTLFDPMQEGVVYFGNDGGVFRSENGSSADPSSKNTGYNTTQFYACAMHPEALSNYFLGGTQDNGTYRLNARGISAGVRVNGGDGFYCHIDEDDPDIQLVSSQFGNYSLSNDGGISFSGGQRMNGSFWNPSDYDSRANILYAESGEADFYRWHIIGDILEPVFMDGNGGSLTTVMVDPFVENRVYFGTREGNVIRVDNAHQGADVPSELILNRAGSVSGIDIFPTDPSKIIVTYSNYGVNNVYVSVNSGADWSLADGNLPDMPVRAVLFNPRNSDQAMIATEAGVWTTTLLDGENTIWNPPTEDRGIALTKVDDLEIRNSDYVVLAATHGRGMWTSGVFADPRPVINVHGIHYVGADALFLGDGSLNADSFEWSFGDGGTSTEENPRHMYQEPGEYVVTLKVNGVASVSESIRILPESELPYTKERAYYGGSFESHEEQYATYTVSGSGFERGKSGIIGKNGTKSGDHAFVIGLNEPTYKANSESYLYLPVYDFSTESIYTFSFWARYFLHPGPDGFLVEYSTNRGNTWQILGTTADKKWYNSSLVENSAFPPGTPYFTKEVGGFTNYVHDLSFLSGQKDVAFRFVFRSESTGNHVGVAIDDVEILAYQGELKTTLQSITGEFGTDKEIKLDWTTNPEYYCRKFEIERSVNGNEFEKIDEIQAKSILSANTTTYTHISNGGRELYFYRLKVTNENDENGYFLEFYSDIITLRRNSDDPITVHNLYPNPFADHVNITFDGSLKRTVAFEVYDAAGKRLLETSAFINSPFHTLQLAKWPEGVYYLSIKVGDDKEKVYPIVRSGF